jgi:uncharacterized membrane protein
MLKTRLEAFSDGVLAIIITIMVLEMKVPHGSQWSNITGLIPVFISYVLSFVYIGIYWGNHHHLLHTAKRVNSKIILANLNLLFWLSLVPFSTGWMGENHFEPNTVALYSANLFMAGVAYFILFKVIEKSITVEGELSKALQKHTFKGIISALTYAAAIPFAYLNPVISFVMFISISILWIIPDKDIERAVSSISNET